MNGSKSCNTRAVHVMLRSCALTAYGLRSCSVDCGLCAVLPAWFVRVWRGCRLRGCVLSGRLRVHIRERWFVCLRNSSFATFTFSLFCLPAIICATEVLVYTRWGRICFNGFQLDQEHAVAFCRWAVGMVIWHRFFAQYGFDATMRMARLEGTRGFPLLVFERLCCDELGLVVR
jgi:hypothetical protein